MRVFMILFILLICQSFSPTSAEPLTAADSMSSAHEKPAAVMPCIFILDASSTAVAPAAAIKNITVSTNKYGCEWTAVSNDAWITIYSGNSYSESATVTYTVDANTTFATRTGTITIAGQTFTVIQGTTSTLSNIGVYANGHWYVDMNYNGAWNAASPDYNFFFGFTGAVPMRGDWDSMGILKGGVYADGYWYFDMNGNGIWDGELADKKSHFGFPGARPVAGDWNGNGTTKVGVYNNANWYLDMNGNGGWDGSPTDALYSFGFPGAIPIAGDWNGSGTTKIGVYSSDYWYLDVNGNGAWDGEPTDRVCHFGFPSALPITGDWTGNGTTKVGVYDPTTFQWYLDIDGNCVWNPVDDIQYSFGFSGALPVAGTMSEKNHPGDPVLAFSPPLVFFQSMEGGMVRDNNGTISLVFISARKIWLSQSLDGGRTFSTPVEIVPETPLSCYYYPAQLSIASNGIGGLHLAWTLFDECGGAEVLYSGSSDAINFSSPSIISYIDGINSYDASIAAFGSRVELLWNNANLSDGPGSGIHYSRSIDNGNSFSEPTMFQAQTPSSPNVVGGRLVLSSDNTYVSWAQGWMLDVMFSRSTNGGISFSSPLNLSSSPVRSGGHSMMLDSLGNIYMTWFEGNTLFFSKSVDQGLTFSAPMPVPIIPASSSCNQMTVDDVGNIYIIWAQDSADRPERKIYLAYSLDGGASFSAPLQVPAVGNNSCTSIVPIGPGEFGLLWHTGANIGSTLQYARGWIQ